MYTDLFSEKNCHFPRKKLSFSQKKNWKAFWTICFYRNSTSFAIFDSKIKI